jgi:hypothetical protein
MLENTFRRIALARGLLPAEARQPPPDTPRPAPAAPPAPGAAEPCRERDDAA